MATTVWERLLLDDEPPGPVVVEVHVELTPVVWGPPLISKMWGHAFFHRPSRPSQIFMHPRDFADLLAWDASGRD